MCRRLVSRSRSAQKVHGISNDTIQFVLNIINTEINSATDNPVSVLS